MDEKMKIEHAVGLDDDVRIPLRLDLGRAACELLLLLIETAKNFVNVRDQENDGRHIGHAPGA